MVIDEAVTRRRFLSGLMKIIAGAGLYSFIPVSIPLPKSGAGEETHPYWLDVLSRGIRYYPGNITSFFSGWNDEQFKDSAQYALFLTLNQNKRVLSQSGIPSEKEMDQVVEGNKTTQYMFEKVKRANLATDADPQITYGNDPLHARVLYDLSAFILRDISETVEGSSFIGFSDFDVMLLDSGTTYLKEAIDLSENAYIFIDDNFKEILRKNIGSYYNCLGLALSYLGDTQQAQSVFLKALEFRPDDASILQNLRDMDSNGLFINRMDYNHSFLD